MPFLARADLRPPTGLTTNGTISSGTVTSLTATTFTVTNIVGQTGATAANVGNVGEVIISSTPFAGALAMTSGTVLTVSTVTLTPGCWSLSYAFSPKSTNASTSITEIIFGISTVSNTPPATSAFANQDSAGRIYMDIVATAAVPGNNSVITHTGPTTHVCLAATTPYYLFGTAVFSISTASAFGGIYAVRER